jgi:hypothetical protein
MNIELKPAWCEAVGLESLKNQYNHYQKGFIL